MTALALAYRQAFSRLADDFSLAYFLAETNAERNHPKLCSLAARYHAHRQHCERLFM